MTRETSAKIEDLLSKGLDSISIQEVDKVSPEISQVVIAKELTQLSMQERDEVFHDIHGVANILQETPEFINERLCSLESELAEISQKTAYDLAFCQSPNFVQSRRLRLMFLRAVQFDSKEAAKRLNQYFEDKSKVFGVDKMTQTIELADLDPDTIACLESGYIQKLGGRDRAGRGILMGIAKLRQIKSELSLMRAFWYMIMAAVEDEETQKRGIVFLSYSVGKPVLERSGIFRLSSILRSLPLRIVGIHVCVDEPQMQLLASVATLLLASRHRVRFRCHCGTDLECQYTLVTFGISNKIIPVSVSGKVDKSAHLEWLEKRRRNEMTIRTQEQQQNNDTPEEQQPYQLLLNNENKAIITEPGPHDVLLGRGKLIQEHIGNQRYRNVIENHRGRYEQALKVEKTYIAKEIVRVVKDMGGRFLKQLAKNNHAAWAEVTTEVAREKVSHSFRNRRTSWKDIRARAAATAGLLTNGQTNNPLAVESMLPSMNGNNESSCCGNGCLASDHPTRQDAGLSLAGL